MTDNNKIIARESSLTLPLPDLAKDFLLRQDVAFFNHGSFGACPRPVFEAYQTWQRELETEPIDFLGRRARGLLQQGRRHLADFVGTTADNLVFVSNVTHGVNIVARSLKLEPGDEVLAPNQEYGAAEKAWIFVCRQRGARYLTQPISLPVSDPDSFVDQFWAGVTERTRVIFMSHITSPTALIQPVAQICRRAREAGILTVIDGAHAPGQIELALDELGADFYTGNCHKWLCAPKGAGFLYARPERQALLDPLIVGWGWENPNTDRPQFISNFEWLGTDDPAAYLTVATAIDYQLERNWPQVRLACHALARQARQEIQALSGLPQICPDSTDWWMQMCTIPLPPNTPENASQRLWEEFRVEVPISKRWGGFYIRVSVQAYNTPQHVERLLEGLKVLLS